MKLNLGRKITLKQEKGTKKLKRCARGSLLQVASVINREHYLIQCVSWSVKGLLSKVNIRLLSMIYN